MRNSVENYALSEYPMVTLLMYKNLKTKLEISKVLVSGLFPLTLGLVTPNIHKDTAIWRSRGKGCIKIDVLWDSDSRWYSVVA